MNIWVLLFQIFSKDMLRNLYNKRNAFSLVYTNLLFHLGGNFVMLSLWDLFLEVSCPKKWMVFAVGIQTSDQ